MQTSSEERGPFYGTPGMDLVAGAVDSHVHCCPHINTRTVTVFDAVRQAAGAGMRAIGLMDVFANSSGLAALAMRELGHLGIEVFGGIILEPYVGGISLRSVETALGMGYGHGGARFVSLPCHHTAFVARSENRGPAYIESCLAIPEAGPMPGELEAIMARCAEADVVFNTGHLDGPEHVRVVEAARRAGVRRILVPAGYLAEDAALEVVALGGVLEFSFFVLSHATAVPQTMIDKEYHRFAPVSLERVVSIISGAGAANVILSSDSGALVLPPPIEALREMLVMMVSSGIAQEDVAQMSRDTPARVFGIDMVAHTMTQE